MASGTGLWAGSGISSRASPEFRFFRLLRGGGASVLAVAFRGGDDVAGGGAFVNHFGRRFPAGGTDARGPLGPAGSGRAKVGISALKRHSDALLLLEKKKTRNKSTTK